VLDFFSGSSTSAHSLFELNLEDNSKRKFIQVQLPEKTKKSSQAYKSGYKTIAEIGKDRIRKVVKKIEKENPEKYKDMDLGFKVFKLDSSNIKSWDGKLSKVKESIENAAKKIKSCRTKEDVLYEMLLRYGLDLTLPIEKRNMAEKTVYNAGSGSLFFCWEDNITREIAQGIGQWKKEYNPENCRVVFKDNGFSDAEKANSILILNRFKITEIDCI
ncbi:MAG: site-specific DNA-methyltransferase, partial [Flavobacteriaceae bacterium]|nr:site-specific DNA-methyltransferase [Flavobacteriaceae bacterium]